VAYHFVPCGREQPFPIPPSLDEWLPNDHLARFVIAIVETLDLSDFYAEAPGPTGGTGRLRPEDDGARRKTLMPAGSVDITALGQDGLEWRAERLVLDVRRKGGCSAPHAVDPVSIPYDHREARGNDRNRPRTDSAGERPHSASAAGLGIGPAQPLKVEPRVQIPLGLQA